MKEYFVYIMTNKRNGTLYIGITNNISRRAFQHKSQLISGFTSKYGLTQLVFFETFQDVIEAIHREKQLKKWKRAWKIRLIEEKKS